MKEELTPEQKERRREYDVKYRQTHKKQLAERQREWYWKNREKVLEKRREYRQTHKEQIAEYKQKWYQNKKKQKLAKRLLQSEKCVYPDCFNCIFDDCVMDVVAGEYEEDIYGEI